MLVTLAVVVVLGLAAGLVVWAAPWVPPPVLRPAGLVTGPPPSLDTLWEWWYKYARPEFARAGHPAPGLSAYHGEIVGQGDWEPLVPEETWRAVRGILDDPTRKPPRGVRTLLGGLALCPCGNVVTGMPSHTGHHIYRCTPATRNRAYHGGHVARQAEPVETFVEKLVVARLSRPDAADLVTAEEAGIDVAGLREEAAAIRTNLEEMAGDCALGRISRAQMLKATQAGTARLEAIGAELDSAARENVLAPLVAAENAAAMWAGLDISRKRAVIKTLMSVTLYSPGKGARRAFDPATAQVTWNQPDAS
jgi:site-specific DNA recombinase